jgi:hypothetical protein
MTENQADLLITILGDIKLYILIIMIIITITTIIKTITEIKKLIEKEK